MAGSAALEWVTTLTGAGFSRVSIINKSYQVIGASDGTARPGMSWKPDAASQPVNENGELAKDWNTATRFVIFGTKFNAISKSASHIVGAGKIDGKNFACVAKDTPSAWIVCIGQFGKGD